MLRLCGCCCCVFFVLFRSVPPALMYCIVLCRAHAGMTFLVTPYIVHHLHRPFPWRWTSIIISVITIVSTCSHSELKHDDVIMKSAHAYWCLPRTVPGVSDEQKLSTGAAIKFDRHYLCYDTAFMISYTIIRNKNIIITCNITLFGVIMHSWLCDTAKYEEYEILPYWIFIKFSVIHFFPYSFSPVHHFFLDYEFYRKLFYHLKSIMKKKLQGYHRSSLVSEHLRGSRYRNGADPRGCAISAAPPPPDYDMLYILFVSEYKRLS